MSLDDAEGVWRYPGGYKQVHLGKGVPWDNMGDNNQQNVDINKE